jgi:hypothetical protein
MRILKNWCIRAKLQYGQSIGQGAGEMMGFIDTVPLGHGPLTNLGRGIHSLADHIESRASGEDMLFSPNFPRIGWRFTSTHGFWHVKARKNGLKIRDIKRRH